MTMARIGLLGSLLFLTFGIPPEDGALASPAVLSEDYDVADENQPHGRIASVTSAEIRAMLTALKELEELALDYSEYKSVHIHETQKYVYVVFSPFREGFTGSGDLPAGPSGIEMQIDRQTFHLRGTKRGR